VFLAMRDVTEQRSMQEEIRKRDRFMTALNEAVQLALQSDTAIPYQAFMSVIGPVSQASRAHVFLNHYGAEGELMMSMVGEWCAEGIYSHLGKPEFRNVVYSSMCPRWQKTLSLGKAISGEVASFPDEEKTMLEPRGVFSVIILPLMIDSSFAGFIGFDDCVSKREWMPAERSFLRAAANCLAQSITRRRMEEDRLRLEQQVQHSQKMESLGVLAGGIAHDFNNLLVAILGNADLALLDIAEDHPALESVREIEQGARRAADLTRQMLAYAGGGQFMPEAVDLSRTIERIDQLLQSSLPKTVTLRMNLQNDLPAIEADTAQLQQIVMNLMRNASEALAERVDGVVEISTSMKECDRRCLDEETVDIRKQGEFLPEGVYVILQVADNGCGMDAETKIRIFDPFFSTKLKGHGLGMAALMGIVRTHNGAISLHSEPGRGTVFRIFFPAVSAAAITEETDDEEEVITWQGSGTILIVDDDLNVRRVASRVLERAGFTVLTAEDGVAGVELFAKHAEGITCVLLDLAMPRMGGEETFRKMREIRNDAMVILSSGYGEEDVARRFRESGLAGYLQKPYRAAGLIAKFRHVLHRATTPLHSSSSQGE